MADRDQPLKILRVFPRRMTMTPTDDLAFVGNPPFPSMLPEVDEVHVSCTFTWDKPEAERLFRAWSPFFPVTRIGGPAYDNPGGEFVPGRYVREGVTVTSRGCPRRCGFCFVPKREGKIRTLKIHPGRHLVDNNLLACPRDHVEAVFRMLESQRQIEFGGGLDARLLEDWHVAWFEANVSRIKAMFFAEDTGDSRPLERAGRMLQGVHYWKRRAYVLVGFRGETVEQAEVRLRRVWDAGFLPFAQFYRGEGEQPKTPEWQRLQRKWTRPALLYREFGRKPGQVREEDDRGPSGCGEGSPSSLAGPRSS